MCAEKVTIADELDIKDTAASHRKNRRFSAIDFLKTSAGLSVSERMQFIRTVSALIIALVAAFAALYLARPVLIPITVAFVLSVMLAPASEWLRRRSVPGGFRALIVVMLSFGLFIGALYLVVRPGAAWIERLPDVIEEAQAKLTGVQQAVGKVQDVSEQVKEITDLGTVGESATLTVEGPALGDSLVASAQTIIVQIIFTAVLTYFFLASRQDFRKKLMLLRLDYSGMLQIGRLMRTIEDKVGAYMLTMLIINLGLGVTTAAAMWAIGMPSPLVWGGLAAVLNFVPYIGPFILTVLLGITGLVNFETAIGVAAAPSIYVALNFIESNFVTPTLIGVRLTISPLAVILNVSFWTWLWGPAGAIISIPVLVIFKTVCDNFESLKPVGLLIGDADTFRPRKRNLRTLNST
ncbi:MAG: AI-2E family transporter [Marinicaulis sp.]|nr:AI-2E family transporter [Marinicaulis sp.]